MLVKSHLTLQGHSCSTTVTVIFVLYSPSCGKPIKDAAIQEHIFESLFLDATSSAESKKGLSVSALTTLYPSLMPAATPWFFLTLIWVIYVSESLNIVDYLDKMYPDTRPVFPNNTLCLQAAFTEAAFSNFAAVWPFILAAVWPFILPVIYTRLNPPSQAYFRPFWETRFGKKLEEFSPTGEDAVAQWAKLESRLGNVDAWYAKNGRKGPFLLGETPSWGDFFMGSFLIWAKTVFGKDSQQWKDIASWHGGRWSNLLESLKEYQTVV